VGSPVTVSRSLTFRGRGIVTRTSPVLKQVREVDRIVSVYPEVVSVHGRKSGSSAFLLWLSSRLNASNRA